MLSNYYDFTWTEYRICSINKKTKKISCDAWYYIPNESKLGFIDKKIKQLGEDDPNFEYYPEYR